MICTDLHPLNSLVWPKIWENGMVWAYCISLVWRCQKFRRPWVPSGLMTPVTCTRFSEVQCDLPVPTLVKIGLPIHSNFQCKNNKLLTWTTKIPFCITIIIMVCQCMHFNIWLCLSDDDNFLYKKFFTTCYFLICIHQSILLVSHTCFLSITIMILELWRITVGQVSEQHWAG